MYTIKLCSFNYEYQSTVSPAKHKCIYSTAVVIFPTLFSFIYGIVRAIVLKENVNMVPLKEKIILGGLYFLVIYATNTALVYVNYPLGLLVRNLRLMPIFIVGIFFSRIKKG
jgi:hypothetical protein